MLHPIPRCAIRRSHVHPPLGGIRVLKRGALHEIHLFRNRVFECTRPESSGQFNQITFDLPPEMNSSMVGAENLLLWLEITNRTSNAAMKVVLDRRMYDGPFTSDDGDLIAWTATAGVASGSEFSNRAKIGIVNRFSVLTRVTTGGSGTPFLEASAALLARQWR